MDLAFRFTEEKYASKTEVMKDLKTSLVDNIWNNILAYRKQYNVNLDVHSFNSSEYVLCNSQFLISKNAQNEMKFLRLMRETSTYSSEDYNGLEYSCFLTCLKEVAKANGLDDSEIRIRSILRNEIKSLDKNNLIIPHYLNALLYTKKHNTEKLSLGYFHELNKLLSGADESSFRMMNDQDHANKVVINRVYTSAPVNLIEPLLTELCNFVNNNQDINSIVKSFIAYFYISMVKPFSNYSDEVACLVAKSIIGNESMGETATIIPYEKLLNEPEDNISRIFLDSQKYVDVTYFVRFGLDFNENMLSDLINKVINSKTQSIKEEYFAPEEPKVVPEVKEEVKVEVTPVPEVKEVEVKEEVRYYEKPSAAIEVPPAEVKRGQLAFDMIPEALDEKEAARLEVHLLESDPSLRKGEARFYARHCTLGKSYTIQQFKKCNGCVYETARTGMEHLVELGYYRKEQVKNKFIYSPINRRK